MTSSFVELVQNWVEGEDEADSDAATAENPETSRRKERIVNGDQRLRVFNILIYG